MDGAFVGVIVGAMDIRDFKKVYDTLLTGPDATMSMFRSDGLMLVHCPPLDPAVGQLYGKAEFFSELHA